MGVALLSNTSSVVKGVWIRKILNYFSLTLKQVTFIPGQQSWWQCPLEYKMRRDSLNILFNKWWQDGMEWLSNTT